MDPRETGKQYDELADWWRTKLTDSPYGLEQLKRAISFTRSKGHALDVGCGSETRFLHEMARAGFTAEGLDVSREMLKHAGEQHPKLALHFEDITDWAFPKRYDLITAWDSTFHLPLSHQEPALRNICRGLNPGGILLFTCGGVEDPGEIAGEMEGLTFEYSGLGIPTYLNLASDLNCAVKHVEYDQGPNVLHAYIIIQKNE